MTTPRAASPTKETLQAFADACVRSDLRQKLKTAEELVVLHGWGSAEEPACCGEPVKIKSMLGQAYQADCSICGKWASNVAGPTFGPNGNYVQFLDPDKVDLDTDASWIIGKGEA